MDVTYVLPANLNVLCVRYIITVIIITKVVTMIKAFRRLFFTGLIVLLPAMVTLYILYFTFNLVDSFIGSLLQLSLGRSVPGLGFLLTIILVVLVGLVATNVVGKRLLKYIETGFARLPLIKPIYTAIQQIIDAFSTQHRQLFKSAALIEYPRKGLYAVGFITSQGGGEVQEKTQ